MLSPHPAARAQHRLLVEQAELFALEYVRTAVQLEQRAKHATAAAASLRHSAAALEQASQGPTLSAQDKEMLAQAGAPAKLQATQLAHTATQASAHALLLLSGGAHGDPIDFG